MVGKTGDRRDVFWSLLQCQNNTRPKKEATPVLLSRTLTGVLIIGSLASTNSTQSRPYAGQWWDSTSDDRHSGYLAGYLDCAAYDKGEKSLSEVSWQTYQPFISQFYKSHPADREKAVWLVFREAVAKNPPKTNSSGEQYSQKHGIFDGEYWRIMMPDERLGFVEGYIRCRTSITPTSTFSKKPELYVSEISKWYRIKQDEIDPSRESIPIATVLYKFRDRVPGRKK